MKNFLSKIFFLLAISSCSFEVSGEATKSEFSLLVHKTPTCGCCKMWIKHLEENGFSTTIEDHKNLQEIKEKYNIKPNYRSCHTGISKEGYIFEGHIPSKFIEFICCLIKSIIFYSELSFASAIFIFR